jgi:hypothetical protein
MARISSGIHALDHVIWSLIASACLTLAAMHSLSAAATQSFAGSEKEMSVSCNALHFP